jgi:hypothetical protein
MNYTEYFREQEALEIKNNRKSIIQLEEELTLNFIGNNHKAVVDLASEILSRTSEFWNIYAKERAKAKHYLSSVFEV